MLKITITEDQSKSMNVIADAFRSQLSEKEIKKTASYAVNITAQRVLSSQLKNVRKYYNFHPYSKKYQKRMANISHYAKPENGSMFASIAYSLAPMPAISFKHKNLNKKSQKYFAYNSTIKGVQLEVRKGKVTIIRHAFIKTMKAGHEGIWIHGFYQGGKLIHANVKTSGNKNKITELKSASPFTMNTNDDIQKTMELMVEKSLPGRFAALLQKKVDKIRLRGG